METWQLPPLEIASVLLKKQSVHVKFIATMSKSSQNPTVFPLKTARGSTSVRFVLRASCAAASRALRWCNELASMGTRYRSCGRPHDFLAG